MVGNNSGMPIVLLHPDTGENRPATQPSHAGKTDSPAPLQTATVNFGALSVDKIQRRAWCNSRECQLTPKEFELLWWFANHPRQAITRSELMSNVWGVNFEGYEHTVSNHINRLRKKLDEVSDGKLLINTVWGVGYRFDQRQEINQ